MTSPIAFETTSSRFEPRTLVTVQAPREDIDRILRHITDITPLRMGAYDSNAIVSAPGTERYRPLEGAAAGAETEVRERPGVVEPSFVLPPTPGLVERVVEAIYQVHSYPEPVIRLRDSLVGAARGLDDRDNPHRWWNTTGDWKAKVGG